MICDLWDSCEYFEQDMQNIRVFWGRQSVAERIDAIGKSSCGSWFAREAAVMSCQSCLEWFAEMVWNGLKNSEGQEKWDSSLNIFISHDGEAWIDWIPVVLLVSCICQAAWKPADGPLLRWRLDQDWRSWLFHVWSKAARRSKMLKMLSSFQHRKTTQSAKWLVLISGKMGLVV